MTSIWGNYKLFLCYSLLLIIYSYLTIWYIRYASIMHGSPLFCLGYGYVHTLKHPRQSDGFFMHECYSTYLLSQHWQDVRLRYRNSKLPQNCYICKSSNNLNLHHKTYKRLGHERLNDLMYLCRDCHELTHKFLKIKTGNKINLWNAAKKLKSRYKLKVRQTRKMSLQKYQSIIKKRVNKVKRLPDLRLVSLGH